MLIVIYMCVKKRLIVALMAGQLAGKVESSAKVLQWLFGADVKGELEIEIR